MAKATTNIFSRKNAKKDKTSLQLAVSRIRFVFSANCNLTTANFIHFFTLSLLPLAICC